MQAKAKAEAKNGQKFYSKNHRTLNGFFRLARDNRQ
jgi:hypothetical protein